VPADLFAG